MGSLKEHLEVKLKQISSMLKQKYLPLLNFKGSNILNLLPGIFFQIPLYSISFFFFQMWYKASKTNIKHLKKKHTTVFHQISFLLFLVFLSTFITI